MVKLLLLEISRPSPRAICSEHLHEADTIAFIFLSSSLKIRGKKTPSFYQGILRLRYYEEKFFLFGLHGLQKQ